ncbi:fused response regulator/phosphatase [Pseudonocardia sp. MH-G8]|uniref:fused response regulator/phosphatase n=1 Tax=Pseudonocardia sp. MH-G8 TaxID=1854588 RepID=UPI000BA090F1|nr:fused response regulator/phosphatase [Pseudonocardia sp. MH-G8]OZM78292.1 hypothetical protein CFP66_31940 [Pseudonocardia sp. MH-G8]
MTAGDGGERQGVVLVVDDNPASRYISGSWLRRHGYEVLEAGTGGGALGVLKNERVDLVVLDVGLPDMSGLDVCDHIKNDPSMMQPVIHLSATSIRGADRARGLNRGADAYLTEPVEPDELLATVHSVLRYYRARAAAEDLAVRLARLEHATHAMHAATGFDRLTAAIAAGASDIFDTRAMALVPAPDGQPLRALAGDRPIGTTPPPAPRQLLDDLTVHAPQPGTPTVRRRLLPEEAPDGTGEWEALLLSPRHDRSPLCIAVRLSPLTDEQESLLIQLGRAAMLATDALRLHTEEHNLALTLQRSFLPSEPPRAEGLETAVRYVPAADNAEIGGDFYELIGLDADRTLIAIGDVAGHSIHAATVMVELRHALRAYAVDDDDPAEILRRLERMLARYHPSEFATLCLLLLDRSRNEVRIANAGHLPPLLVHDGGGEYLEVYGAMLGLGVPKRASSVHTLPPAWSIVLVTDGLIEAPSIDLDDSLEELRGAVCLDTEPEELCTQLLERFDRRSDDIALLVIRKPAPAVN